MDLLHAGVEQTVIALWLGHESIETTQAYLDADLALKETNPRQDDLVRQQARQIQARRQAVGLSQPTIGEKIYAGTGRV